MVTRQITLAIVLLLALCAPAYAESILYDTHTVGYQTIGMDFPPYFTAGTSVWISPGQIALEDAGPQSGYDPRWTSSSPQLLIWEAFTKECPFCVSVQSGSTDPRESYGLTWIGGPKDPFASFYLRQTFLLPHYSITTESYTVGIRVGDKGPRK